MSYNGSLNTFQSPLREGYNITAQGYYDMNGKILERILNQVAQGALSAATARQKLEHTWPLKTLTSPTLTTTDPLERDFLKLFSDRAKQPFR